MSEIANAIVETIRQPVLVLERDLTVAIANPAFLDTFKVTAAETNGAFVYELGNGQWNIAPLRRLLAELLGERDHIKDYRVEHSFEGIGRRVMLFDARRLEQPDFERILIVISDVTEKERMERERVARQEFSDKLIDSIREALIVMDVDLRVERVNQSFCEIFGVDPAAIEGHLIYEVGNGQWDIPDLRKALEEVLPENKAFDDYAVTHDFPRIGRRVMRLNGRKLDHMPLVLLAVRDDTERMRNEENQKLLVAELQHRVKNILANVQGIANATRRRSNSLEEFENAFFDRLDSLARTQELLMRGPRGLAKLHDLVAFELAAHGWAEDGRLAIRGPDATLTREQAQAVAMVVHELATNAVKYGAFSRPGGRLDVGWDIDESGWLNLEWREHGVQIMAPPVARGFGSRMIEGSAGQVLGGSSALEFGNDGVNCRLSFPLDHGVQGPG